jgi:hypothetical protein
LAWAIDQETEIQQALFRARLWTSSRPKQVSGYSIVPLLDYASLKLMEAKKKHPASFHHADARRIVSICFNAGGGNLIIGAIDECHMAEVRALCSVQ